MGYSGGKTLAYEDLNAGLHGFGQRSWIFVWRSPHGSDDLTIYDEDRGRVVLRLNLQPSPTGTSRVELVQHHLINIDGFFEESLIAVYTNGNMAPHELPVVITWSDTRGRYVVAPLLPAAAAVSPSLAFRLAPSLRDPTRFAYASDSSSDLDVYPVDSFRIFPGGRSNPSFLAVGRDTTMRFRGDLGLSPVVAVTVYSLSPLISSNDVPRLTCVWPGGVSPQGWVYGARLLKVSPDSSVRIGSVNYDSYSLGRDLATIAQVAALFAANCNGPGAPYSVELDRFPFQSGLRDEQVQIGTTKPLSAALVLTRHGELLAYASARIPPSAFNFVLPIPHWVAKGKAILTLSLTNSAGFTRSWQYIVEIPVASTSGAPSRAAWQRRLGRIRAASQPSRPP
jgi:hypothetical protein